MQERPWHLFPAASHQVLRLADFDDAMHADRRQASLRLHTKVELVEALAIAVHIEIGDSQGHCFQKVHDCSNVTVGSRALLLDLLDRHEACLVERGVDVPSLTWLGPLWRRSLQGVNKVRASPLRSSLRGQERAPTLEDAVHFPWAKGGRTGEHQIKGGVCKGEASVGPLSMWLRAT